MKLALALILLPSFALANPPENTLTPAETAAGWTLLFDGSTPTGWRGYKQDSFPTDGWSIADGCIKSSAGGAPDIITTAQYGDFELSLEWKASPKGNSGIIYRVAEKHDASWQTGPEYQLLEDTTYGAQPTDMHSAGALYDLCPPAQGKVLKPVGEFNSARIIVKDGLVTHFVNGFKVLQCRIDDASWTDRINKSKFKDYDGFGVQPTGHIGIQHHGNDMWFRNIKVRDLSAPMPGQVKLFNDRDMTGWTAVLPSGGTMDDTWSVADGIITCKGNPIGYIRTNTDYTNYVLKLEWRFNPVTKQAGNSGVLLRKIGEDKVWPRSIEAQLQSGSAGDFWNIENFPMTAAKDRTNGRNTRKTHANEHPIGEWNEYEIIVDGPDVTLKVNGEVLNQATECLETPGKICLQSEGAEIHFRNIRLAPIPGRKP